jgi:septal ring factor EnvC (AmiA/AmiB activator)
MNARTINSWKKKIEKKRDEIAKTRDQLRELIGELEALEDCCYRAHESLQDAADALSEMA